MKLFSADNCAFRWVYYRIVLSSGLSAIFVTARFDATTLRPYLPNYFTGHLSRCHNYGGLWNIKSEGGKDEGQGDDEELRILHTAGSFCACYIYATVMKVKCECIGRVSDRFEINDMFTKMGFKVILSKINHISHLYSNKLVFAKNLSY